MNTHLVSAMFLGPFRIGFFHEWFIFSFSIACEHLILKMTVVISDVGEEGALEKYLFPLLLKSRIALSDIDGVSMNP